MWIILLIFIQLFSLINANIYQINFISGPFTVHLIYNSDNYNQSSNVAFVKYTPATREVWLQTVYNTSTTFNIGCRRISQQRIIWGPNGCSDTINLENALQTANCLENNVQVEERLAIFLETWYLSKLSNECFLKGGMGDIRLCMGPLRITRDNIDSFLPKTSFTSVELITSRMRFLDGLIGPLAMSPTVVEVPLVLPSIEVIFQSGSCVGGSGISFEGAYTNYELDNYVDMITDVWKDWKGPQEDLRFILKREGGVVGVDFRMYFAQSDGFGLGENYFSYWYESDILFSPDTTSQGTFFLNWVEMLDFTGGTVYTMNPSINGTGSCDITLTLNSPSTSYQLVQIPLLTAANYSDNATPRRYWKSRVCNVCFGRLDSTGNLFCPNTPEGDISGGDVAYVYPENPFLSMYVPADSTLSYRLSCEEFYPKNNTFLDYGQDGFIGRSIRNRQNIQQQHCFSPFIIPELISSNLRINEKEIQCNKLGGYTWNRGKTLCAKPITLEYCQEGWIYFDQNCYYKFNPELDGRFSVPIDQADDACGNLFSLSKSLIEVDQYLETWLLDWYIYWKPNPNREVNYRIPNFKTDVSQCTCFNSLDFTRNTNCPCFEISDENEIPIYPICFYSIANQGVEPKYKDVSVSLQTATIWKNGQEGPKQSGFEGVCNCFDGWTGKNCERATCPLSNVLRQDVTNLNALTTFFRKCYENKHGSCFNGQPRICQCNFPYGPSASILSNIPFLYEFKDYPCACPAGIQKGGKFQINENVYEQPVLYLPCSGLDNGVCLVDNSTNTGRCACQTRQNILEDIIEPGFDGKSCACPIPIQPYLGDVKNGIIVSELCNYRGTCCPFGQNQENPLIGNLYSSSCFDSNDLPVQGCSCDNGWGGEACTCRTPFNLALNRPFQTFLLNARYIDLGERYFITKLNITFCQNVSKVEISNEILKPSASIECFYNSTSTLYDCPGGDILAYQFVVLTPPTLNEEGLELLDTCKVEAFELYFQYCGANNTINPFSGRFFDIPAYRSNTKFQYDQFVGVATFGCTLTDCFCNSNYGGELCGIGVSSVRPTTINRNPRKLFNEIIQSKKFCGETVLVPKLTDSVQGRGQPSDINKNCTCNPITNLDVTGRVGRVQEAFTGTSCQCANVYSQDRDDVLLCAGHGDCREVNIPYGRCELDITKYSEDSLSNPFTKVTSFAFLDVDMNFAEDSLFFGEDFSLTQNPTTSPTEFPTGFPTLPTQGPTLAPISADIIFYSSGALLKGGDIQDGVQATQRCRNNVTLAGVNCDRVFPFLGYTTDNDISDLQTFYNFDPDQPLYGPNKTVLIDNTYRHALNLDGAAGALQNTLIQAGVFPSGVNSYWTGAFGGDTCTGWTLNIGSGQVGSAGNPFITAWFATTSEVCSDRYYFICGCVEGTFAPTTSPTKNPTQFPTSSTNKPTASPTPASIRVAYKAEKDSLATFQRVVSDVEYCDVYTGQNTPLTNITATFAQALIPIWWTDLVYREFVIELNKTVTRTVNRCNPAVQSIQPGMAEEDGPCPYREKCILSEDCTDDLSPNKWTIVAEGPTPAPITEEKMVLYFATTIGEAEGNLGSRAETNLICEQSYSGIDECTNIFSLLSYSPVDDLSTLSDNYDFPDNITVYSESGVEIGNWTTMISGDEGNVLFESLFDAGVTGRKYWTGSFPNGTIDLNNYCNAWSDATNSFQGAIGTHLSKTGEWINELNRNCNNDARMLCGCSITNTPPTPAPTDKRASQWPDLRGCVCSHSDEQRTDVSPLPAGEYTLEAACVKTTLAEEIEDRGDVFLLNEIECNNFIDRTINCQILTQVPSYVFQCTNEPISCYDFSIGRFFGAFDIQHPTTKYSQPREDWTLDHYKGISSTINDKIYYENNILIDPLTSEIWNSYYWFNVSSNLNIESEEITSTLNTRIGPKTYQIDLKQGRPLMSDAFNFSFAYNGFLGGNIANQCVDELNTFSTPTSCRGLLWPNMTDARLKRPGFEQTIKTYIDDIPLFVLSLTIKFNYPESVNLTGVEVYNQEGTLCGQLLRKPIQGESVTFACVGTYADFNTIDSSLTAPADFITNGGISIRFLGTSIWDIPGSTLIPPPRPDNLTSFLYTNDFSDILGLGYDISPIFTSEGGSFNLIAGQGYDIFNFTDLMLPAGIEDAWPQRKSPTWDYLFYKNESYINFIMNYTLVNDAGSVAQAWDNVSNAIIFNNTYPFNAPLFEKVSTENIQTEDIDFENQEHLNWLYEVWANWLSPRRCGAEDVQCETFGLGSCIIDQADGITQKWFNGDEIIDYEFVGDEGGCRCYQQFDRGYYYNQLMCQTCKPGYGPATISDWSDVIQYSNLISPLFNNTQFPFNELISYFTTSPTTAPTPPTLSPTTPFPTIPAQIKNIFFFNSISTHQGDIGNRTTTDLLCNNDYSGMFSCENTFALLSYDPVDNINRFPTIYSFDKNSKVFSLTGTLIGNWTIMTSGKSGNVLDNTINTALGIGSNFWTGSSITGANSNFNCLNWTDNTVLASGMTGRRNTQTTTWISRSGNEETCDNSRYLLCGCISTDTIFPTQAPTIKPTVSPTEFPSLLPTLAPTNLPTPFPTFLPTISPAEENNVIDFFERELSCRLPFGIDPVVSSLKDINLCAGHGLVSFNTTIKTVRYKIWKDNSGKDRFPTCTKFITREGDNFILKEDNITDINNLIYVDQEEENIITIINTKFYLNSRLCIRENCIQTSPDYCTYRCPGEVDKQYLCQSDVLYISDYSISYKNELGNYLWPKILNSYVSFLIN